MNSFQILCIRNTTTINIIICISLWSCLIISFIGAPGVKFADSKVFRQLILFYTPTISIWKYGFPYLLVTLFLIFSVLWCSDRLKYIWFFKKSAALVISKLVFFSALSFSRYYQIYKYRSYRYRGRYRHT